jgi:hypothetical protein
MLRKPSLVIVPYGRKLPRPRAFSVVAGNALSIQALLSEQPAFFPV